MFKNIFFILSIIIVISCKKTTTVLVENNQVKLSKVNDTKFVIDTLFKKGDARRYGVYPNKKINPKRLTNIIFLANKGLPISFPKGYYNTNIILKGISNAQFNFDDVVISGLFKIINKGSTVSNKINIKGELTILDKLFIRKSTYINFEKVSIITDTLLNKKHKKNRGVSIYAGSKNIHFNELNINDTGGEANDYFTHVAASLQLHGWNDNPENVSVSKLTITNAARTAMYITGNNHIFKNIVIRDFGLGSSENIFPLGDAYKNEEKEFAGFWMNRCYFCEIDSLIVNNKKGLGKYSLNLDEGESSKPSFIYNIHFDNNAKKMPIKDDKLTNILVKNEF